MKVKEIMIQEVDAIDENQTLKEVLKKAVESKKGSFIVTRDKKNVGIVTTWDVLEAISQEEDLSKIKVCDVMEEDLVTISADATLKEAAKIMVDEVVWRLPVEEEGRLVGIVSATDIFRAMVD